MRDPDNWFWAAAIGPDGSYNAGESPHYEARQPSIEYQMHYDDQRLKAEDAHRKLVKKLTSEGWEPVTERGKGWWELRFRRNIK